MLILGVIGNPRPVRRHPRDVLGEWDTHWYHDSSAVLVRDGVVVAGIEEERLTRRKHEGRFPTKAIQFCLASADVALDALDCIAFGERGGDGYLLDPRISEATLADVIAHELECSKAMVPRVRLVEHHLAHAMSAYAPSGLDDALVVTFDGFGDGIAGIVASAVGGHLTVLSQTKPGHSLGGYYSSILPFLGYGKSDEYKVMGLAPYGDPSVLSHVFRATYELLPEGRVAIRAKALEEGPLADVLKPFGPARQRGQDLLQFHSDVAAAVQTTFEEMVFHTLRHFRAATGQVSLCLAGGSAQNCTLNGAVAASGMFERVFVQPAAYDAGLALGAALGVEHEAARTSRTPMKHVFWGTRPPPHDRIEATLAAWSPYLAFERPEDICVETAGALASGQVVGWMQGRSEFGPRALGNRSILADPRPAHNKTHVNEVVKKREDYRPFAPAVVEEDAGTYFEFPVCLERSPFMTFVVKVKPAYRSKLAAVTHVDGTARVQTVSRHDNEQFWALLRAFEARTGFPILLNTSFNNDVEPIVDSLDDAIECFLTTSLDRLVVGRCVVRRGTWSPAAILSLVPRLRADTLIARGTRGDAPGAPLRVIGRGLSTLADVELSPLAYEVLSADNRGDDDVLTIATSRAAAAGDLELLAAELRRLWSARLVTFRPKGLPHRV